MDLDNNLVFLFGDPIKWSLDIISEVWLLVHYFLLLFNFYS